MGMSIDNHIEVLKSYHNGFTGWVSNIQDSIDVAVDIMNKYRRIQEIMNNAKDSDGAVKYNWLYEQIGEVLKDGNDQRDIQR